MKAVFLSLEFSRGLQATVPQQPPDAENKNALSPLRFATPAILPRNP